MIRCPTDQEEREVLLARPEATAADIQAIKARSAVVRASLERAELERIAAREEPGRLATLALLAGEGLEVVAKRHGVAPKVVCLWRDAFQEDELKQMTRVDGLIDERTGLSSEHLAEKLGRSVGRVDFEHAKVCAEARGMRLTGSVRRWRIKPAELEPVEPVEELDPTDEQRLAMERVERRAKRQERELGLVELPRPQKLEPPRPQKLEPRTGRLCAVPDTFWG